MRNLYKSLSEEDLHHGIRQAEKKIKVYKRELQWRRNYRATRCSENCSKPRIVRSYMVLKEGYGTYGVYTTLCEEEHRLSTIDLGNDVSVVEELEDNKIRIVPQEELDDYSRKLYGLKGGEPL